MILLVPGHPFAYEMECVVRLFYPGEKIEVHTTGDASAEDTLLAGVERTPGGKWRLFASVRLNGFAGEQSFVLPPDTTHTAAERALGRLLFGLLARKTGITPAWGVLTGVRPVHLCRSMAARGMSEEAIRASLLDESLVAPDKMDLALEIARAEQALLDRAVPNGFSLYISIPFCPSRCLYCSFVSHDIAGMQKLVPDYLRLLCEEIRRTGALAHRLGMRLQTVYVGGGTPTALAAEELADILAAVRDSFDCSHLLEYTVEAGRPDTVTPEKFQVLRDFGVERVSINPQTMDDAILRAIGRGHTAAEVVEAFALARAAGFATINMDLIAGLPGESAAGFAHTVEQVAALRPENITVHTLTVKRSSRLREQQTAFVAPPLDVGQLLDGARTVLTGQGYRPYYLYRQKGTVQNLENTGYALPGHEGLYNVLIMEEEHTILAVGAGATTKLYRPNRRLQRIFNFKFPYEYIARFEEILQRKAQAELILKEYLA